MTLSRKTRQEMHDNALVDTAVSMCFLAAALEKHAKEKGIEVIWR